MCVYLTQHRPFVGGGVFVSVRYTVFCGTNLICECVGISYAFQGTACKLFLSAILVGMFMHPVHWVKNSFRAFQGAEGHFQQDTLLLQITRQSYALPAIQSLENFALWLKFVPWQFKFSANIYITNFAAVSIRFCPLSVVRSPVPFVVRQ